MICCSSSFLWRIEVDVVALIQCTSPFVRVAHLNEAIAKMTSGSCDSVFSVTRSHSLRWTQLAEQKIDCSGSSSSELVSFSWLFFQQLCSITAAVSTHLPYVLNYWCAHDIPSSSSHSRSSGISRVPSCSRRHFSGCAVSRLTYSGLIPPTAWSYS